MPIEFNRLAMECFETAPEPTAILAGDLSIVAANREWRKLSSAAACGKSAAVFHPRLLRAPEHMAPTILDGLRTACASSGGYQVEFHAPEAEDRDRVLIAARPVKIGCERFIIVERKAPPPAVPGQPDQDEDRFRKSLWAAVVKSTEDAILTYDLEGRVTTWNGAAEKLYEYTAEEMIGVSLERLYPLDWPTKITTYRDRILAGELVSFEAVRVTKSGKARTVAITGAPVMDEAGQVIGVSNIHRDVTELRRQEEIRAIRATEAVHRSKNLMAVISAIQRQVARTSATVPEASAKFSSRLQSLGKSVDLLVQDDYQKIPITDVVRSQLDLFGSAKSSAVNLDGPDVLLEPQATQTLGMVLFELLTNALKYGALSATGGKVDFRWRIDPAPEGRMLRLSWTETGGPYVSPPDRRGFGSTVLTRLASATVRGEAKMEFRESGLFWSLAFGENHFSG